MKFSKEDFVLTLASFLTTFAYTITISFFPALAEKKGMHQTLIGILFGLDPLIGLPATIIVGRHMTKIGRKKVFIAGILFSATGFSILSIIHSFRNDIACILSFVARVISGLGTATYMTAAQAILLNKHPDNAETIVARFEAVGGLGFLLGPIVGYFFSESEVGCFGVCGCLLLFYGILCNLSVNVGQCTSYSQENSKILELLNKPPILFEFLAQMTMLLTLGYLSAVIEIYLQISFHFDETTCGLLFSIYTISYFSASLIEPFVSEYINHEGKLICLGTLIASVSFLLMSRLVVKNYLIVLIGLGTLGIGNAFMIIPTIARILRCANYDYGMLKDEKLVDTVSSLTLFFSNSGEIIGPFLGTFLVEMFGYSYGFFIMALIVASFLLLYIKFTGILWAKDSINFEQVEIVNLSYEKEEKYSLYTKTIH